MSGKLHSLDNQRGIGTASAQYRRPKPSPGGEAMDWDRVTVYHALVARKERQKAAGISIRRGRQSTSHEANQEQTLRVAAA